MKKLLLLMIMVIGGLSAFSQQPTATETAKHQTKQVQNPAAWACPACFKITKEGGSCAADNTQKIQLGTYYCPHCVKATGNKPGQCDMCKGKTVQMTRKYCAQQLATKKAA